VLIVGVALYLIPTIIAIVRKVPNVGSVIVINLFLGWTLIGWVVALAMAATSTQPRVASPPGTRPTSATRPTFTLIGHRYRFGYSVDPASYSIWDSENPGPPVERFPYSEHGKKEGFERLRALGPETSNTA
jgi:hypothetical protein